MMQLQLKGLTKQFGGLIAVKDFDMTVGEGEIVGLIGPNGAGKTTIFNLIAGIYHPNHGQIFYKGENISRLRPHEVAQRGIFRTFQKATLITPMTALDNVIMGFHLRSGLAGLKSMIPSRFTRKKLAKVADKARQLLHFLDLESEMQMAAADLSNRDQKLLQIGIACAGDPELLLLDEPVAGMNLEEIGFTMGIIQKIREKGTSVLVVEHNMKAIMEYCERVVVSDHGQKIAEGSPEEVKRDEKVIRAYLGSPDPIT